MIFSKSAAWWLPKRSATGHPVSDTRRLFHFGGVREGRIKGLCGWEFDADGAAVYAAGDVSHFCQECDAALRRIRTMPRGSRVMIGGFLYGRD